MIHSGKSEEYMCVCKSYCATVCEKASAYTQYGEVNAVAQSIVFLPVVYSSISNGETSLFSHQSLV